MKITAEGIDEIDRDLLLIAVANGKFYGGGMMIAPSQDRESGKIPTFWVGENYEYGKSNFWINCQIATAFKMMKLADFTEANGIN